MPVYVGTSGYYYREWVGPFYPDGTTAGNMLERYSDVFDALEINATYYRPPDPGMFAKYPERTAGQVKIIVKLHSAFTHERSAEKEDAERFEIAVEPLKDAGQFGAYLAQFPQSFHNTAVAREHIEKLRLLLPDSKLVMEFRHDSWWRKDVLAFLKELEISMSTVDLPEITGLPPTVATYSADPAYLRLHGRNSKEWYEGREPRYTYQYNRDELDGILKKVQKLVSKSDEIFVLFNNHPFAHAPINAQELLGILRELMPNLLPPMKKSRRSNDNQIDLF